MKMSSEAITEGIRVQVSPQYIAEESIPDENEYFFAYTITIENKGNRWAKLLNRHWKIIDSEGYAEDVKGVGVVGYQPQLKPGDAFTYTSYCPLNTAWGTMEGKFEMVRTDGERFFADISRFYLVSPNAVNADKD